MSKKSEKTKKSKFWDQYTNDTSKAMSWFRYGLLLDTEPLVIYLVGLYDKHNNSNYLKNLGHDKLDFTILTRFFERLKIKNFIVTPHVLSEFCSLTKIKIKPNNPNFHKFLEKMIPRIKEIKEIYTTKDEIIELEYDNLKKHGIADAGVLLLAKQNKLPIITNEWAMNGLLEKNNSLVFYLDDLKCLK